MQAAAAETTTATKPNGAAKPENKAAPVSRMSLGNVVRGPVAQPITVVLYGPEGVGKSTFGACAPNPIFLASERGTNELDVARLPEPRNLQEFYDGLTALRREEHDYQTLVIDSVDWLEPLIHAVVCRRFKVAMIDDIDYGKGFTAAATEFRKVLKALEDVRDARRMNIVLLAHSSVVDYKNPEDDDYQRYELASHKKIAALAKQWADAVLFANYETTLKKNKTTKRVKAEATGARVMHTDRRAAYDAKNRYNLPHTMPLQWEAFEAGVRRSRPEPTAKVVARIEALCATLDGFDEGQETAAKIRDALGRANDDSRKLRQLENWGKAQARKLESERDSENDAALSDEGEAA